MSSPSELLSWNLSNALSRPRIASELPSNLLFRKIGARLLLSTAVILWGTVATLQGQQIKNLYLGISLHMTLYMFSLSSGFVSSYAGLATARAFLGLVEGPIAPGIILYMSGFYTRKELSFRYHFLFCRQLSLHFILDLLWFTHQLGCVVKVLSEVFWLWSFTSALERLFRVAGCRNREYGWNWGKTWMGLDILSGMFCVYLFFRNYATLISPSIYRKDYLPFSWALLLSSLCPRHHMIPSF